MAAKKTTKPKAKPSRKTTKTAKKTTKKTAKKTSVKKTSAKKKPFGGYAVSFAGRKDTVETVFGKKPIPPSQMTKKLWAYVKAKKLSTNS